jgi:hypothetical protein
MPRLSKTCAVVGLMLAWASITGAVGAAAALEASTGERSADRRSTSNERVSRCGDAGIGHHGLHVGAVAFSPH